MKKILTVIILLITFIIIYLLQVNFFSGFTIAGVMPNLFIIFVLFIGLYSGARYGTAFGILIGLFIDLLGSAVVRTIGNSFRCNWISSEDIWKKIFQKIVK